MRAAIGVPNEDLQFVLNALLSAIGRSRKLGKGLYNGSN